MERNMETTILGYTSLPDFGTLVVLRILRVRGFEGLGFKV